MSGARASSGQNENVQDFSREMAHVELVMSEMFFEKGTGARQSCCVPGVLFNPVGRLDATAGFALDNDCQLQTRQNKSVSEAGDSPLCRADTSRKIGLPDAALREVC